MTTGSLSPVFLGNWTSFGGHLLLIALSLTTTRRSQNIFKDSGILRVRNPGTAGVDAFFQDWQHENCLVVPPVVLLLTVLVFMFRCDAGGTLLVPYWPSAPFWPLLVHKLWSFVVDCSSFEGRLALRHSCNTNSLLGSASWDSLILAMKLQFSRTVDGSFSN